MTFLCARWVMLAIDLDGQATKKLFGPWSRFYGVGSCGLDFISMSIPLGEGERVPRRGEDVRVEDVGRRMDDRVPYPRDFPSQELRVVRIA
jgi:hypothetical protein